MFKLHFPTLLNKALFPKKLWFYYGINTVDISPLFLLLEMNPKK